MQMNPSRGLRAFRSGLLVAAAAIAFGGWAQPAVAADNNLVFSIVTDIHTTDPDRVSSGGDWNVLANVFEALMGRDREGKLAPELATDVKVSEDGLVYDFTLREGVKFHNGDPFTAEDVVFSWKRATDPELKFTYVDWVASKIVSAEAIDPLHVRLTIKSRNPTFLKDLKPFLPIVPKSYIGKVGNEGFAAAPVGTGPFKYVSREVQSSIQLAANKDYWGTPPGVDSVTLKVVPDENTRMAMLMAGETDVIANVHPLLVPQLEASSELKPLIIPALQANFLMLNPQSPIFEPKVREALNLAIDRAGLTQALFMKTATPMATWCLEGREVGCTDMPSYAFDLEKAKALIDESGYDKSRPVRIFGLAPGGRPQTKETVEAVASYLSALGLKSEITLMEFGAYLAFKGAKEKDYSKHDLIFYTWATWTDDPVSQRLSPILSSTGTSSFYRIPEMDAKFKAIADAPVDERTARVRDAMLYVHEQNLVIPLLNPSVVYGLRSNVEWTPPADLITPLIGTISRPAM
jgi:peptide/nickel transport system substrate-binding protein